jgi:hypothetical protein
MKTGMVGFEQKANFKIEGSVIHPLPGGIQNHALWAWIFIWAGWMEDRHRGKSATQATTVGVESR